MNPAEHERIAEGLLAAYGAEAAHDKIVGSIHAVAHAILAGLLPRGEFIQVPGELASVRHLAVADSPHPFEPDEEGHHITYVNAPSTLMVTVWWAGPDDASVVPELVTIATREPHGTWGPPTALAVAP